MAPADSSPALARLEAENAELRARLQSAERSTAQTLARATRLSQVISVLGQDADFDSLVERASIEVAELFSADIALLMVGPDAEIRVEGQWGVRASDVPNGPFALAGLDGLTPNEPVLCGAAGELALPSWLERYGARHGAWARLLAGDQSLGLLLLARRSAEPFERSDERELRAIAYRIALAMENGLLHRRMTEQLLGLSRIHHFTMQLAGMLELEPIGARVASMLVSEVPVEAGVVRVGDGPEPVTVARCGCADDVDPSLTPGWTA